MPYRGEIAVQRKGESTFSYYACVDDHDDCPTCGKYVGRGEWSRDILRTRCYPEKRARLRGWWWWKILCSLGGAHDHYRCKKCNTIWVCFHVRQPKEKIHT